MTVALQGGEWSAARLGRTLPPGKTRYPFCRRLGGPQGQSGRVENLIPTGIRSQTVQPVVSRYTDWATQPTQGVLYGRKIFTNMERLLWGSKNCTSHRKYQWTDIENVCSGCENCYGKSNRKRKLIPDRWIAANTKKLQDKQKYNKYIQNTGIW
jgi:hypothetical protein